MKADTEQMTMWIKSKKLKGKITFIRPAGASYLYVDLAGVIGRPTHQMCGGGKLTGDTISYSGCDRAEFAKICRKWYRSFRDNKHEC